MSEPTKVEKGVIKYVQYSALTPDQIRKFRKIYKPYNPKNNDPTGTPYDPYLGALENGAVCPVCNNQSTGLSSSDKESGCPGHFGYIELEEVCWNLEYVWVCVQILKSVCLKCSKLRIPKSELEGITKIMNPKRRIKEILTRSSKYRVCWNCNSVLPKITKKEAGNQRNLINPQMSLSDGRKVSVPASVCYDIFIAISDEDFSAMGHNLNLKDSPEYYDENGKHYHAARPESFLFVALPVTPISTRPWVTGKERNDDDITQKYNDVLKVNALLAALTDEKTSQKKSGKKKKQTREELVAKLQAHVSSIISSDESAGGGARQRKGIKERIEKKDGHIIKHVAGKRVDQTERTVIVGAGGMLNPEEVGVSEYCARKLTVSVTVEPSTKSYIERLIKEKKVISITRNGISVAILDMMRKWGKIIIRGVEGLLPGDKIERQLMDGDYVIINRQPTLRVESMQGGRVKIMKGEFGKRIPLHLTRAYNADFDGDEMNLHVVQNPLSITEVATLTSSKYHIVSPQNNSAIMGAVQNTVVIMYCLTNYFKIAKTYKDGSPKFEATMVEPEDFFDVATALNISDDRLQNFYLRAKTYYSKYIRFCSESKKWVLVKKRLPGRLLVSLVFPESLTWERKTDTNEYYPVVYIKHGILIPDSGPLCSKVIGRGSITTVHTIWKYYSPSKAIIYLNELEKMTSIMVGRIGFSIGMSDCVAKTLKRVEDKINEVMIKCEEISKMEKPLESKERDTNSEFNNLLVFVSKIFAKEDTSKGDRNSLVVMKICGAKGSDANNYQISACVGQQNFSGKRMPNMLGFGERSLPHFRRGKDTPMSRGFVRSNYVNGLRPDESFYHARSGRDGIISTGIKTADTGYSQKKISKKTEDCVVCDDGSVRDGFDRIIQYLYGGDGFNPKYLTPIPTQSRPFFVNPLVLAGIVNSEFEIKFLNSTETLTSEKRGVTQFEVDKFMLLFKVDPRGVTYYSTLQHSAAQPKTDILEMGLYNIRKVLIETLELIELYPEVIPEFFKRVYFHYASALAPKGYPAGLICASAIGEPSTQMTLNVFHNAGNAAKDVTVGVPRLKELLAVTTKPATPSLTVVLKKELAHLPENDESLLKVASFADSLRNLKIGDVLQSQELFYTDSQSKENGSPITFIPTKRYRKEWWFNNSLSRSGTKKSIPECGWILRLKFNLEMLIRYFQSGNGCFALYKIASSIEEESDGVLIGVCSPFREATIDIYTDIPKLIGMMENKKGYTKEDRKFSEYYLIRDLISANIEEYPLSGITGISKTFVRYDSLKKEWMIDCQVAKIKKKEEPYFALVDVSSLDQVEPIDTLTDNVWEWLEYYGIEAARSFLVREYTKILGFDSTYIDLRHITLLADRHTYQGILTAVNRNGIVNDSGPLAKCMFETSGNVLSTAAALSETDNMQGVASSIFYGSKLRVGTGVVEIEEKE